MEKIVGVNELRPKLTQILNQLETGEDAFIVVSNSTPKAVLLRYEDYITLKEQSKERQRLALRLAFITIGARAEDLTETDVEQEIADYRRGRSQ
jgi:prevent-host-death family protein